MHFPFVGGVHVPVWWDDVNALDHLPSRDRESESVEDGGGFLIAESYQCGIGNPSWAVRLDTFHVNPTAFSEVLKRMCARTAVPFARHQSSPLSRFMWFSSAKHSGQPPCPRAL